MSLDYWVVSSVSGYSTLSSFSLQCFGSIRVDFRNIVRAIRRVVRYLALSLYLYPFRLLASQNNTFRILPKLADVRKNIKGANSIDILKYNGNFERG